MKYEVGDRVRIKSLDWYNNNINAFGTVCFYDTPCFIRSMKKYCDKVMTITEITNGMYRMKEDNSMFCWTDKMIECLVKEETISDKVIEEVKTYEDSIKTAWICPDGYIFKDKNGNIINATMIVLEKKEKEYPKTYEECCKELEIEGSSLLINTKNITEYERDLGNLMGKLHRLIICRDAYWKIAGEEMGLDKPWEPDWTNEE